MFGFLSKRRKRNADVTPPPAKPVVRPRDAHCISRKNIDSDALRVLYRLSDHGYDAYLVGGGVRDLLLGRNPKDFDVGTNATPDEIKHLFRNCLLIGRRFRLAHIRFRNKIIETATFRAASQTVGEIIEHAAEGPLEDNTFGTPETDAHRRDFTVNGLFYDIKTFAVIDYVGGLEDLERKLIRSIGDPMIRFREDPVRMMRAIKFSSRLGFAIEEGTDRAIRKLHSCILTAAPPRVCEEVFRLFGYGAGEAAFRLAHGYGLLADLLPDLAAFIDADGGQNSCVWRYLAMLDRYERAMHDKGVEVSNGLRTAVLYTAMARKTGARKAVGTMLHSLKVPRHIYFSAAVMIDSVKRLMAPPAQGRGRLLDHRDFLDALDYCRIVARTEGRDEQTLDAWANLYNNKQSEEEVEHERSEGTEEDEGSGRKHGRRRRRHRSRRH